MAKTTQCVEQEWLTERWLHENMSRRHTTRTVKTTTDRGEAHQTTRRSEPMEDSICRPTLEKLYAAQRRQKEDLKRQIDDAMAHRVNE